jgi:hypothetical protein
MLKFACTKRELSCIIGTLFVELEPPCTACGDVEHITICGTTYTGAKAALIIAADGYYFDGIPEDLNRIRGGRCANGATRK